MKTTADNHGPHRTGRVICDDARPEYQYAAVLRAAGEAPFMWLPSWDVTTSDVSEAMGRTGCVWGEHGQIVKRLDW